MATAFMGGQAGYDEAGNPIGAPAPAPAPKQAPLVIPKPLRSLGTAPPPIKAPPVIAPKPAAAAPAAAPQAARRAAAARLRDDRAPAGRHRRGDLPGIQRVRDVEHPCRRAVCEVGDVGLLQRAAQG